jgi:hypothetical protein
VPDVAAGELREIRAREISGDGYYRYEDVLADLERWDATLGRAREYDEVVLWYEHDLFDQLNLIQVLDALSSKSLCDANVSLVSVGTYPGRRNFKGMGELRPAELAPLFDARRRVTPEQYLLARAAWAAFRAPDPRRIEALLESDTSALPFLASALRRHLEEFPSTNNGLSRSESRLLGLLHEGCSSIRDLFPRMHVGETAFYITDLSLWSLLRELASTTPPLVEVAAPQARGWLPSGTATLTADGERVSKSKADRVRLCGIDRWLGGVHLRPDAVWRWDPERGELNPPEARRS